MLLVSLIELIISVLTWFYEWLFTEIVEQWNTSFDYFSDLNKRKNQRITQRLTQRADSLIMQLQTQKMQFCITLFKWIISKDNPLPAVKLSKMETKNPENNPKWNHWRSKCLIPIDRRSNKNRKSWQLQEAFTSEQIQCLYQL